MCARAGQRASRRAGERVWRGFTLAANLVRHGGTTPKLQTPSSINSPSPAHTAPATYPGMDFAPLRHVVPLRVPVDQGGSTSPCSYHGSCVCAPHAGRVPERHSHARGRCAPATWPALPTRARLRAHNAGWMNAVQLIRAYAQTARRRAVAHDIVHGGVLYAPSLQRTARTLPPRGQAHSRPRTARSTSPAARRSALWRPQPAPCPPRNPGT